MTTQNPTQLFTIPILSSPSSKPFGAIVCTTPPTQPTTYILTFTSPPDNRLITPFCQALLLALDILEFSYPHGVVITTSGIPKFYSNGLELEHARSTPGFWTDSLFKLFRRLLTYPMPTIALLPGHAFAGGLMLAMYHDYRLMSPSRGFLCLNELLLGVPLQPAMSSIFRQKLPHSTYHPMVLEARRFSGQDALAGGIVDGLGGMEEVLKFVEERKLGDVAKTGVYAALKREMYRETLEYIDGFKDEEERSKRLEGEHVRRREEGEWRVKEWKRNAAMAKL